MTGARTLVLDANILIRATLGSRARDLIDRYCDSANLTVPAVCVEDARGYLPALALKRGWEARHVLAVLESILTGIEIVPASAYATFEPVARQRLGRRDEEDWHVLALALAMDCPVWTEDQDFFGTGVATWKLSTVEGFLEGK